MMRILFFVFVVLGLPTLVLADANNEKLHRVKEIVADAKEQPVSSNWLAEKKEQESEPPLTAMKMLQGLGLCVGLFFVVIAVLKRWKGSLPGIVQQRMQVIERIAVSPKTSLVLARLDHKEFLLAVGSEEVNVISKSSFPGMNGKEHFDQELSLSLGDECETDIPLSA